jgi:hypothetical protein
VGALAIPLEFPGNWNSSQKVDKNPDKNSLEFNRLSVMYNFLATVNKYACIENANNFLGVRILSFWVTIVPTLKLISIFFDKLCANPGKAHELNQGVMSFLQCDIQRRLTATQSVKKRVKYIAIHGFQKQIVKTCT